MLQPKKTKYRKQMKGRNNGFASAGSSVSFGDFALKATSHGMLTSRQIEAARRALVRYIKRGGKVWIRVFPDKPITKKPLETRQGKGKGNVEYWASPIKPGKILYEVAGVSEKDAKRAFELAGAKFLWEQHLLREAQMAKNKLKDYKGMKKEDLKKELIANRKSLFENGFKHKMGQLKESHLLKETRKKYCKNKNGVECKRWQLKLYKAQLQAKK